MQPILITCKNCGHQFTGKYCSECGEKVYTDHDRKLSHFFEEGLHFITHFEGKFFATIKTIFSKPGKLSEDYCNGIRKKYFKPLSLFLLLVVVYLLFPVFEGLNMRLFYHLRHNIYGEFARNRMIEIMQETKMTDAQITEAFKLKSEKVSKFLLVVILPLTALCLWALTFKKRRYFFDQMVFSTEINIVYLIWGFMILPLLLTITQKIFYLFAGHYFPAPDDGIGIIMYAILSGYVGMAAKRFYRIKKSQATLLGVLFFLVHFIVVQLIYKFILFVTVINQIH